MPAGSPIEIETLARSTCAVVIRALNGTLIVSPGAASIVGPLSMVSSIAQIGVCCQAAAGRGPVAVQTAAIVSRQTAATMVATLQPRV